MCEREIHEAATKVQKYAEDVHCASAIFAVEQILTERYREKLFAEIKRLSNNMEEAISLGQLNRAQELLKEKNELLEKSKKTRVTIHIAYENLTSNGARLTISDEGYTIILPECHQKIIRDCGDNWTEETIKAKNALREMTIHEIGHIVCSREECTETDIASFAETLLTLRNNRPQWFKNK